MHLTVINSLLSMASKTCPIFDASGLIYYISYSQETCWVWEYSELQYNILSDKLTLLCRYLTLHSVV